MKMRAGFVLVLAFVLGCARPSAFPAGRWLDLSHDFSAETIYWPTAKSFELELVSAGRTPDGFYYAANNFCAAEHGGTHVDAPVHFAKDHQTVDQIPVETLIGPAVVIDVVKKASANRDYQITAGDLLAWETRHGKIPDRSILLLHTGQGRSWPDPLKYLGTARRGPEAVTELHFPGLHPDAAHWLVTHRKINAIGLDTPSIDYGQSRLFESHQILFAKNIPAFENVANLEQLPTTGALVVALPMKIKGGSGGPLRIVALVPAR